MLVVGLLALLAAPPLAQGKRNVYVSAGTSDNVAAFDIATDGALGLVAGSPFMAGDAPRGVAATPDGRHLYIANQGTPDSVSAFDVATDGTLSPVPGSPFASAGTNTRAVTASPDGRHLYVANGNSNDVSVFDIASNGALSPVPGSPFAAGESPYGVAATPDGRRLYVANNQDAGTVTAFQIGANGALTPVAGSPFGAGGRPVGVVLTPDGRHLYVANQMSDNVSAFAIGGDGALTPVAGSPFGAGDSPFVLAVTPDGRHLYVANSISNTVSAYDIGGDGALSPVAGSFTTGNAPRGIAATPDGRRLYLANAISFDVSGFDIGADGTLSPVPGSPFAAGVMGSDFGSLAITPNQGPAAAFSPTPSQAGSPTTFDATSSSDSDGAVARYDWDFGDGTALPDGGPTPNHTYAAPGTYDVTLTVTDDEGCSTSQVYTGQTAHCNGSAQATAVQQVTIPPDTDPPGLRLSGPKRQPLDRAVEIGARCDEVCTAAGAGKIVIRRPGKRETAAGELARRGGIKLKPDTEQLQANAKGTLKLKLPRKARRAGTRALKQDRRVIARIKVTATDAVGNAATEKRGVKLKPKGKRGK